MVIMKWLVQSQSKRDLRYVVSVNDRGEWRCDCPQGKYRRDRGLCKHVLSTQAGQANAVKLPSHEPGRVLATAPGVSAAPATAGGVAGLLAALGD